MKKQSITLLLVLAAFLCYSQDPSYNTLTLTKTYDQLKFEPSGLNRYWIMSKPNDGRSFALYSPDDGGWFTYWKTSSGDMIMNKGKLGIGTSSPIMPLDVSGSAKIGNLNDRQYLRISSSQWPEIRFETPTSNEQIRIGVAHSNYSNYSVEEGDFYVYTQTVNQMPFIVRRNGDLRLNLKGGSVGIGTATTGTHRLAVEGSIGAREIKVEASGWSDFVFENDYELRTLEEVEQHIKENGHLPEIPSEAEATENGINLGEMDAKLLQKIEELTLYLIEQNKEIKELKELTLQQQTEIELLNNK